MCSVARQEDTCVALALDETVNGITVGLDTSNNDSSLAGIVGECSWFLNTSCTSWYSLVINACRIINSESNIPYTVSVFCMVGGEDFIVWIKWWCEDVSNLIVSEMRLKAQRNFFFYGVFIILFLQLQCDLPLLRLHCGEALRILMK